MFRTIAILIIFLFSLIFSNAVYCTDDLKKYSNVRLSIGQLERIARYDSLIRYYCDNMQLYGPENRVNPNFLRALIVAESNIEEGAVSIDEAYGLTQITPETGNQALQEIENARREYEDNLEERENVRVSGEDLLNPEINIFLATYLLSKYNAEYDGRLDLVVSAWNAGPKSIKNNEPPNYRETLDIIGKINGYYHHLLALQKNGLSFLQ